ncbi:hypothetical protein KSP39_PZI023374 [Platanthera zijinensis]|uniref:Uncharacterized protein n=1 Tax=Platanthera zijinensis TaxID=2320716 RepID=A0AAP0AWH3_9ASPA
MKARSACRGKHLCFGRYALQALEPAWITARQINRSRAKSNDTRCASWWKDLGTYLSRQTFYSKTYGNTYGFGQGIPRILGIRCETGPKTF